MLASSCVFHHMAADAVGTASYSITVNGKPDAQIPPRRRWQRRRLRMGPDAAGPGSGLTTGQQQAIGALVVDAGVASNTGLRVGRLRRFHQRKRADQCRFHSRALRSRPPALSNLEVAVDANLDAGLPVGLGNTGNGDGHAVWRMGTASMGGTEYSITINMGWSGACNAWYKPAVIIAGGYDFNTVDSALYNVDPHVKGENHQRTHNQWRTKGVAGVSVTAVRGLRGSYGHDQRHEASDAFKGSPRTRSGRSPQPRRASISQPATLAVTTGKSGNGGGVGDRTGADFASQLMHRSVSVRINASAATARRAEWRVNGGAWQAGGATVSGCPIGTGTISFHGVKGWSAPAAEPVTVTGKPNDDR